MTSVRTRAPLASLSAAWLLAAVVRADVPPPAPGASPPEGAPAAAVAPPAQVAAQARTELQATSQTDIAQKFEPVPGGLTAEEVVRQALVTSPELKKARLELSRAEANKRRARIAFAPRLDVLGKYTRLSRVDLPGFSFAGQTFANPFPQILDQWYGQASASVPITDFFLTILPTYKGANLLADVADQQRKARELQVAYDARVTYYNYVHLKGALIVSESATELLAANVRDLEALVQAGTATETDLVRARSALAQAEHTVMRVRGGMDVARTRLAQLVGAPVAETRGVGERLLTDEGAMEVDATALTERATHERPEVKALRTLHRARRHFADSRAGAQYPRVAAFANGYYANPNQRIIPLQDEFRGSWDVGVSLSWSPNDFVFARTQMNDAESDLATVEADLRAVEDGIGMEVANAVANYRTARSEVQATTQVLEASRRYFDDQRALMLAGAATPNDVLQAQTYLTRDALDWVDSYVNTRIAEAALLKVQGKTGLEPEAPEDTRKTP